jgi:co-chaperonin GroES (HSP10)
MPSGEFRPVGKNLLLLRDFGGQKTTEAGIIYEEKVTCRLVWSKVIAVGDQVTEDIKVGDRVLWDITKVKGNHYKEYDVVHQDHAYMVERV